MKQVRIIQIVVLLIHIADRSIPDVCGAHFFINVDYGDGDSWVIEKIVNGDNPIA
jgi:hypothetical protein